MSWFRIHIQSTKAQRDIFYRHKISTRVCILSECYCLQAATEPTVSKLQPPGGAKSHGRILFPRTVPRTVIVSSDGCKTCGDKTTHIPQSLVTSHTDVFGRIHVSAGDSAAREHSQLADLGEILLPALHTDVVLEFKETSSHDRGRHTVYMHVSESRNSLAIAGTFPIEGPRS